MLVTGVLLLCEREPKSWMKCYGNVPCLRPNLEITLVIFFCKCSDSLPTFPSNTYLGAHALFVIYSSSPKLSV